MQDLVNSEYSPIILVRQHLSALLHGKLEITMMLLKPLGCDDFATLCTTRPADALLFRRMVNVCDGWVHRKHHQEFLTRRSWPWRAAMLGDDRVDDSARRSVATDLAEGCQFCLDEFGMRRLICKMAPTKDTLVTPTYREVFRYWADLAVTSARVECAHARNNRNSDRMIKWQNFAARVVNRGAMEVQNSRADLCQDLVAYARVDCGQSSSSFAGGNAYTRLAGTMHGHSLRRMVNIARPIRGVKVGAEHNRLVRAAMDSMTDAEFDAARYKASLSRHIAYGNRRRGSSDVAVVSASASSNAPADLTDIGLIRSISNDEFRTKLQGLSPHAARQFDLELGATDLWIASSSPTVPSFGQLALAAQSDDASEYPVSAAHLESLVSNTPGKSSGLRCNLKAIVNQFGTGVLPTDPFPSAVGYPRRCRGWCSDTTPTKYNFLCISIIEQLDAFRKRLGKPHVIAEHDPLFACELTHSDRPPSVLFAVMVVAGGQAGRTGPMFDFGMLRPRTDVHYGMYNGLILDRIQEDYIASRCPQKSWESHFSSNM